MNHRWLNYVLDQATSVASYRSISFSDPTVYQHSKNPKRSYAVGVPAVTVDPHIGHFFISTGSDGSISLWEFDSKISSTEDDTVLNKRHKYVSGSASTSGIESSDDHEKIYSAADRYNVRKVKNIVTYKQRSIPAGISSTLYYDPYPENLSATTATPGINAITNCLFYSHDNGMFMTAGSDHKIRAWDTATFESVHSTSLPFRVNQIDTQDNLILCALQDKHPRVLDLRNMCGEGMALGVRAGLPSSDVLCSKFLAGPIQDSDTHYSDTRYAVTGDSTGLIRTWDLRMGNRCICTVVNAHSGFVNDITLDRSGCVTSAFLSTGKDGKCKLWSSSNGQCHLKRMVCSANARANRLAYRTSKRLVWNRTHFYLNSDEGDLLVYKYDDGKLVSKVEYPDTSFYDGTGVAQIQAQTHKKQPTFLAMDIQRNTSNGVGPRLLVGTDIQHGLVVDYGISYV